MNIPASTFQMLQRHWLAEPSALTQITMRAIHIAEHGLPANTSAMDARPVQTAWGNAVEFMDIRDDGVAVVPVHGPLGQKLTWFDKWAFEMTDYLDLRSDLEEAAAQGASLIVLDMNSPGGEVLGLHDFAKCVAEMNEIIPVVRFNGTLSASAAEYLSAGASLSLSAESAINGSIGSIAQAMDYSGYLEKLGIKARTFTSGDLKGIGNPYNAMPEAHQKFLQDMVNDSGAAFRQWMRDNRGEQVPDDAMRGQILRTSQALEFGLIDGIAPTLEHAIAQARETLGV
mgnify:CR=1 FL=1